MAVTVITPVATSILETRSGDLVGLGDVATTPADGWLVSAPLGPAMGLTAPWDSVLFFGEADATGDTITIAAGNDPPSKHAGVAATTILLAASDLRCFTIDPSRHVRTDGKVLMTCVDAGTRLYALQLPIQTGRGG